MSTCFEAWRARASWLRHKRDCIERAVRRWQDQEKVKAIGTWRAWYETRLHRRRVALRALSHWQGGMKSHCFETWCERARGWQRGRARMERAIEHWTGEQQQAALRSPRKTRRAPGQILHEQHLGLQFRAQEP